MIMPLINLWSKVLNQKMTFVLLSLLLTEPCLASIRLTDMSLQAGVDYRHVQHSGVIFDVLDAKSAAGCAADFNNDGWIDLVLIVGSGQTRFYGHKSWWQNQPSLLLLKNEGGRFVRQKTFNNFSATVFACAVGDLDKDGYNDLIVAGKDQNYLFNNEQNFVFKNTSIRAEEGRWNTEVTLADVNQDGWLDIYFSGYLKYKKNQKKLENSAGFVEQNNQEFSAAVRDGSTNKLYLNNKNFQFSDASQQLDLDLVAERTISSVWSDFDGDGLIELVDLNDAEQPMRVRTLTKRGTFNRQANNQFFASAQATQYLAVNDLHTPSSVFISRSAGLNNLFLLNPNWADDIGWEAGLNTHKTIHLSRWGSSFADLNNDGNQELIIATGRVDKDPFATQMTIGSENLCWQQQTKQPIKYTPVQCFDNQRRSSRSVIKLDFDNDGRLDLLFLNNNDFPRLLHNQSDAGNWLSLDIQDRFSIKKLWLNDKQLSLPYLYRQAMFSQHDGRIHIGLGKQKAATITIQDEANKKYQSQLNANQFYHWSGKGWQSHSPAQPVSKLTISAILKILRAGEELNWRALPQNHQMGLAERLQFSTLLQDQPDEKYLYLYLDWLKSAKEPLKSAAADAIKQLESEKSTHYLIQLLQDGDNKTFCLISDIFYTWYAEEEAVAISKYKALPFFYRAVEEKQRPLECITDPLGESEHNNAASILIPRLKDASEKEKANLINALGKIRQTEAIQPLLELIENTHSVSEIQQAIIALQRLNFNLHQWVPTKINNNHHLFIALALLQDAKDQIVINKKQSIQWISDFQIVPLEQLPSSLTLLYLRAVSRFPIQLNALLEQSQIPVSFHPVIAMPMLKHKLSSRPDYWLTQALSTQLEKTDINLIKKEYRAQLKQLPSQAPSALAQVNRLAFWPELNTPQQKQLFTTEISLTQASESVIYQFIQHCQKHQLLNWPESNPAAIFCRFVAEPQTTDLPSRPWLETLLKIEAIHKPAQQTKYSIAILRGNIDFDFKLAWASYYYQTDIIAKNWLNNALVSEQQRHHRRWLIKNYQHWIHQSRELLVHLFPDLSMNNE